MPRIELASHLLRPVSALAPLIHTLFGGQAMKTLISLGLAAFLIVSSVATADAGHHHRGHHRNHKHKHHHRRHAAVTVEPTAPVMVASIAPAPAVPS
jgi:hypothetical protein